MADWLGSKKYLLFSKHKHQFLSQGKAFAIFSFLCTFLFYFTHLSIPAQSYCLNYEKPNTFNF